MYDDLLVFPDVYVLCLIREASLHGNIAGYIMRFATGFLISLVFFWRGGGGGCESSGQKPSITLM